MADKNFWHAIKWDKDGVPKKDPDRANWLEAIDNGADPEAPFGRTEMGTIRIRALSPIHGTHRGPSNNTTTGKGISGRVDQTNWKKKLQHSGIKFDDDQKDIYLEALARHGMKGRSANEAGVSRLCVNNHLKNDPDFLEARDAALDDYRDKFVEHAVGLAYDGIERKRYDKDGKVVETIKEYPIKLIELELKRIEPGFREKQTIDINANPGGVLVAPAEMSPQQWIEDQKAKNDKKAPPSDPTKNNDEDED